MNNEVLSKYEELYHSKPTYYAYSPGRVDLMGSHTDYNHGYVVTMPVNLVIDCAFSANDTDIIEIYSCNLKNKTKINTKTGDIIEGGNWAKYMSAVVKVLLDEDYELKAFSASFCSTIPIGSGLSSSAALEAIAMAMLAQTSGFKIDKKNMALLSQRAENVYVGVNCGILDQYSVIFGERHKVIKLDCRELTHKQVSWPEEIMVAICNTNKPRELHGSEYDDRRAQCEEAVTEFAKIDSNIKALRDVSIDFFHQHKNKLTTGAAKRAEFIIEENNRTHELEEALTKGEVEKLKDIFKRSFNGAKDLFEISNDAMENMYKAMSSATGVVASRQAGAGFGGCMVSLVYKDKLEEFKKDVFDTYKKLTGIECDIYGVKTALGTHVETIKSTNSKQVIKHTESE
ncbi:galactokinase [Saccharicrinis fermentans]|uniref:Galactokinase n=1 Tax=Saccharicrinis fermentans DSM 9555 = JCM 21142 TaxID=869213 RepID=W7YE10_9BACT|nr:galactokinase [Saccharicrinis fermentans]GAF02696.1 galactokinase [Saccharicrinis fermentans DSM 9555 = JCM 21142]